ncbi:hypothetical protein ACN38_g3163 [Penicillium nordicum]|uniref:Uncharacterized protein n=1 Tax=Penicillium nordicum TaxID=229535 RepID=A0A0M9WIB0_9EURO|nr:hypothetical protein ACN38_g3163 [Penicillium nordicum]
MGDDHPVFRSEPEDHPVSRSEPGDHPVSRSEPRRRAKTTPREYHLVSPVGHELSSVVEYYKRPLLSVPSRI